MARVPDEIMDHERATIPPLTAAQWKSSMDELAQSTFSSRQSVGGHRDLAPTLSTPHRHVAPREAPRICPAGGRLTTYLGPEHLRLGCQGCHLFVSLVQLVLQA